MVNVRELALDMLLEITEKNTYSHILIREVLQKYDYLDSRDKGFLKRLTEGTLERKIQIDYLLNQFSKVKVAKMKPLIRGILRMSVYQILYMDNVPDSAVCNEAVKLAGKRGFRNLQGFVNGVLRNMSRKKQELLDVHGSCYPDQKKEPVNYLSIVYSMPEWIIEKWQSRYGIEQTECMLRGLLAIHAVTVRVNEQSTKQEREDWIQALQEQEITIREHPYLEYAYELSGMDGVRSLPGFDEGFFMVQDVSSMLVAQVANIPQNGLVLDVCAAPGGKALHAAAKLKKTGQVIARDLTESKVALIQENIDRLGYDNIKAQVQDARVLDQDLVQKADVVFTDVPCSGLGILGKKRDIKYHVTPESLTSLGELQRDILRTCSEYVKPGGILMYSTCTINEAENEQMVQWITQELPFETESMRAFLPGQLQAAEADAGMLQLLPGVHETDGFFLAKLRRVKG